MNNTQPNVAKLSPIIAALDQWDREERQAAFETQQLLWEAMAALDAFKATLLAELEQDASSK